MGIDRKRYRSVHNYIQLQEITTKHQVTLKPIFCSIWMTIHSVKKNIQFSACFPKPNSKQTNSWRPCFPKPNSKQTTQTNSWLHIFIFILISRYLPSISDYISISSLLSTALHGYRSVEVSGGLQRLAKTVGAVQKDTAQAIDVPSSAGCQTHWISAWSEGWLFSWKLMKTHMKTVIYENVGEGLFLEVVECFYINDRCCCFFCFFSDGFSIEDV